MPFLSIRFFLGILGITLGSVGFILTRNPVSVDDPLHFELFLKPLIGGSAVFFFWWMGLMGWGRVFSKKLKWPGVTFFEKASGCLALGSVFAYLSTYLLMNIFPHHLLLPAAYLWSLGGISFLLRRSTHNFSISHGLSIVLVVTVGLKWIEAIHLQENGDPFVCYLTAPRLWFDAHSFAPYLKSPIQFLASAWDSLNQWGNFFLAGPPGTGLVESQRFAQWVSVVVGYAGLAVSLVGLLASDERQVEDPWIWIAVIAGLSVPDLRWTASLAKHDIGSSFWALAALIPARALRKEFSWQGCLSVGLLLGAAVIAKPTIVIFAFFIIIATAFPLGMMHKKMLQFFLGTILLGGISISVPIVARNLIWTGNPVYPWLNSIFRSPIAGPMLEHGFSAATKSSQPLSFSLLLGFLKEVFFENTFNLFSFLFLIGLNFEKTKQFREGKFELTWIAWASAIVFCITLRKSTEPRYLGPVLPLIAGLGVCGLRELVNFLPEGKSWSQFKGGVFSLAGLWVLAVSQVPFYLLLQMDSRHFRPAHWEVVSHFGGKAKEWLRQNVKRDELILALGDNEVYYVSSLQFAEMRHHPEFDRLFSQVKNPEGMISVFKKIGAQYYYRAPVIATPQSHFYLLFLDQALQNQSHCLRYSEPSGARIYDIPCLKVGVGEST